jgi:hypothetical protein
MRKNVTIFVLIASLFGIAMLSTLPQNVKADAQMNGITSVWVGDDVSGYWHVEYSPYGMDWWNSGYEIDGVWYSIGSNTQFDTVEVSGAGYHELEVIVTSITYGEWPDPDENYLQILNDAITLQAGDPITMLQNLRADVDALPDEVLSNPNARETMINKIDACINAVETGNFNGAYNDLLHDIKPKLSGVKADENNECWGNGVAKSWVTDEVLNLDFANQCNTIMSKLSA